MRNINKLTKPDILKDNEKKWTSDLLENSESVSNKRKYKHKEIKQKLKEETADKCIYCESKIGHNTPGDIEHKKPVSKFKELTFNWDNLTIACNECNRRKNNYYSKKKDDRFLDPYHDDVESMIIHHGPIMKAKPNKKSAEISLKILELDNSKRMPLILRKIEKITDLDERIKRFKSEDNEILKDLLKKSILDFANKSNEFSAMVDYLLKSYNFDK